MNLTIQIADFQIKVHAALPTKRCSAFLAGKRSENWLAIVRVPQQQGEVASGYFIAVERRLAMSGASVTWR